jgi:hypothetical protein
MGSLESTRERIDLVRLVYSILSNDYRSLLMVLLSGYHLNHKISLRKSACKCAIMNFLNRANPNIEL